MAHLAGGTGVRRSVKVMLQRTGHCTIEREVSDNTSIREFLENEGITLNSETLHVNAQQCDTEAILDDGDVITITQKVSGGNQ